jgi:hypothetical protein
LGRVREATGRRLHLPIPKRGDALMVTARQFPGRRIAYLALWMQTSEKV